MLYDPLSPEESPSAAIPEPLGLDDGPFLAPVPSLASRPVPTSSSSLTPLVCDERAISALLGSLLEGSGQTISSVARNLGVDPATIRQYVNGRRGRPSLLWFVRFAAICGAKVIIEFPTRHR